ncbi:hypothetical protein HYD97_00860 [Mycoplasmopsis bovis]|nr:hypothetical protein [Mycoplasmopsis bovis]QQH34350.1 hypothetical protein HYD97_00860 [Mycoplasmopsis bovis]
MNKTRHLEQLLIKRQNNKIERKLAIWRKNKLDAKIKVAEEFNVKVIYYYLDDKIKYLMYKISL